MMQLAITEDKTIRDVQAEFNHAFPYLKLEFVHGNKQSMQPVRLINPASTIGDIVYSVEEGNVQLSEWMTVSELEDLFRDRFGLGVQVFRKSGNTWLQTTITDKWTLKLQNEHGRELSQ